MNKLSLMVFFIISISNMLYADRVIVSDGTPYDGAIIKSDEKSIYLQTGDTIFTNIPHALISKVLFRYADVVYLLTGEEIKCKLLSRSVSEINVVTEGGFRTIKIMDLKRYFYNDKDSLQVSSLPPTGDVFNNEKSLAAMDTKMDKTIFVSLSGGIFYPDGKAWQEDFIVANSLLGTFAQGQAGFTLVRNIAVYAGYMFNQYNNTTENNLESTVKFEYFHLGAEYLHTFDFLPGVNFSLGGDFGIVTLSGNIYTYSYRNLNIDDQSSNIGFRFLLGARLFFLKQFSASFKTGYFSIQDFNINVPAEIEYDVILPLSGWIVMAGASFHMSL